MFCIMCRLEKERERKWKSRVALLEARSCQNDQLALPCAMLEVGRLSFLMHPIGSLGGKNVSHLLIHL